MRIALFYCTVRFSTQEPETLFESKNYLDFFVVVLVHFFLVLVWVFCCCSVGVFNPLNLIHKAGLH